MGKINLFKIVFKYYEDKYPNDYKKVDDFIRGTIKKTVNQYCFHFLKANKDDGSDLAIKGITVYKTILKKLFKFDSTWRFIRDVIDNTIDTFNLVNYSSAYFFKQIPIYLSKISGHGIERLHHSNSA